MMEDLVLVTRAGGFIGGLVADLRRQGYARIRAVGIKPLHDWYQLHDGAEDLSLDLNLLENWRTSNKPCATR